MSKKDYYDVLGVAKSSSQDEIKKAFRKKAIENHPDRNSDDAKAEERFKEINEAYSILSNDEKRRTYDQFGHSGVNQGQGFNGFSSSGSGSGFDFSDIFEDAFGGENIFESFFGGGRGGSNRKGDDLKFNLEISLEDSYNGKETTISFVKKDACETCHGHGTADGKAAKVCNTCGGHGKVRQNRGVFSINTTCNVCHGHGVTLENPCRSCRGSGSVNKKKSIKVNIPAGIDNGQSIKIPNEGGVEKGVPNGDLYVSINLIEHDYFMRKEHDLHCTIPISLTTAVLGTSFNLTMVSGEKIKIKIPTGTQPESLLRVKHKGMSILHSSSHGDLYITFKVKIPEKLNDKSKKLYQELALENKDNEEIIPLKKIIRKKSFFGF